MSSNQAFLLEVCKVSKTYQIYDSQAARLRQLLPFTGGRRFSREFKALQEISFSLKRGESIGVIGNNGAGKSTLLQIIAGTLTPTSGSVNSQGRIAAVLELGAGFNPEYSGRENVELYCKLFQMSDSVIRERFEKIVDFSELRKFIDQPIKTYSSGMLARLAFSVIAHVDADVLIIDEALSVGDAVFSQKCIRFLDQFKVQGSIFFVSHDLSAVRRFCDKVIWLENGGVRAIGDTASICDKYLAEVYPGVNAGIDGDFTNLALSEAGNQVPASPEASEIQVIESAAGGETCDDSRLFNGQIIRGFKFVDHDKGFGTGDAQVAGLELTDVFGRPVSVVAAHLDVRIKVSVKSFAEIKAPIVGFFVKDRLGQPLFGANTFLTFADAPLRVEANRLFQAVFEFKMPMLIAGAYTVTAAIAAGTLEQHTQLHWLHDAAVFEVSASALDGVLVGIPMSRISMSYVS
jgi:lipopolysaccharide transport system ATP-binding protein